jgi:putative RNA 2'-phosphotransferase
MNKKKAKNAGYRMSKILRHAPGDSVLDNEGYTDVDLLLIKLGIDREELDWVVDTNNKKRFAYNEDKTKIRANQGHNKDLKVDVKMEESGRVDNLYHGTAAEDVDSIMKTGLSSRSRQHVHLSKDIQTAQQVGSRHSKNVVILKIDTARMRADNIKIWISENDVYLTEFVDPKYISY